MRICSGGLRNESSCSSLCSICTCSGGLGYEAAQHGSAVQAAGAQARDGRQPVELAVQEHRQGPVQDLHARHAQRTHLYAAGQSQYIVL